MKSSEDGRDEFSGVTWKLSGIQRSGWGKEVNSTSQERWTKTFKKKIIFIFITFIVFNLLLTMKIVKEAGIALKHKPTDCYFSAQWWLTKCVYILSKCNTSRCNAFLFLFKGKKIYNKDILQNRLFSCVELDHINPAHTISAALCYATQLVNILSHILDVNLPKKLCNRLQLHVNCLL